MLKIYPSAHQKIDHSEKNLWPLLLALLLLLASPCIFAANQVKVAALKFGTGSWELDVIKHHALDREEGFNLEVVELAGKQATMVALQSATVNIAITDWIWVSRQRNQGKGFAFVPYSTALGALVIPAESHIRSISDLQGKRLGIAGGPLDKSWLLLQALSLQKYQLDLASTLTPIYAAPPLLNQQLLQGRIDAVLNFWPYVARLKAVGMQQLISVEEITGELGIGSPVPFVGYVFDEKWAQQHPQSVSGFIRAATKAKQIMLTSDQEWQRVRPLMKADDEATFMALRDNFRSGIPGPRNQASVEDAKKLFDVLYQLGGKKLVGETPILNEGTFWSTKGL